MNGYEGLGRFYDRLMPMDTATRADYLLALFERHESCPRSLLDLACGTGTLCAELAKRGYDMTGTDISEEMLAEAAVKVNGITPEVLLLRQDMRQLDLNDTVDGAICTQDSLSHLLKTAEIREVLQRLRLFIAPSGLLIFDVNTPYKHRHVLGNHDFVLEEDGVVCTWQNLYTEKTGVVDMWLDMFEEQADGSYARTTDHVRERAYTARTWRQLLAENGFSVQGQYAFGTFEPPADDCERWVFVARNERPAEEYVK